MGVAASFQMASSDPSLLYLYSISPLPHCTRVGLCDQQTMAGLTCLRSKATLKGSCGFFTFLFLSLVTHSGEVSYCVLR
jgi:hypothetical protein